MKIVVLDGHTLNPGDLNWDGIEALGSLEVFDRTPVDKVLERSQGAEVLLTNKTRLTADIIGSLPDLRYIGVLATGFNVVDIEAARQRRIPVTNAPGYSTRSVAQLTFALLLELTHRAGEHSMGVRNGRWTRSKDFCYWEAPLVELDGLTMGIVGFGQIGREVANLALSFGMKVLVHTRTRSTDASAEVEFVGLENLLKKSDVASLHCPLTKETEKLIDEEKLGWMKSSAFLINTSRGPLIDETALADALNKGVISGAGLDVLSSEPPGADNPLLSARNCVITPHIAWATLAARKRLMAIVVQNLRAFLKGTLVNVVNGVTTKG